MGLGILLEMYILDFRKSIREFLSAAYMSEHTACVFMVEKVVFVLIFCTFKQKEKKNQVQMI